MKITIDIDDNDRFELGGEDVPWTLTMRTDKTGDELIMIDTALSLIGSDIPSMLRELADHWPAAYGRHAELITLDLRSVTTGQETAELVVPVPEPDEAMEAWARKHLDVFGGDHNVEITESTVDGLVGRRFLVGSAEGVGW